MCDECGENDLPESIVWEDQVDDSIASMDGRLTACADVAASTESRVWTIQERLDRIERSLLRVMAVMLDPSTDLTALAQQFVNHGTAHGAMTRVDRAREIWRPDNG